MELLVTGGLLGLGYLLQKDPADKDGKKKFLTKVPDNRKPNGKSIYQSERAYQIFENEWQESKKLYNDSQKPAETNVVFSGPPAPLYLNKVDYEDKTLPVEFNSYMTYDNALLDVQKVNTIANQDNDRTKNNMSRPEAGGNYGISLTGDPINPNNFTHNNLQPYFAKISQNVDEYATRGIFENFTGDMDSYQHKQEQGLFFEPQKNVTNVYGASNLEGYQLDRYYISNLRNNETPIEKVYVAPGLNNGYTSAGASGIKGTTAQLDGQEYALPKTTDELRVKNKPKISYYGRIVSGQHIAKPGKIGTLFKNRPDTFWIETPDRYFTTTGAVTAPAARPCQVLKYTNRKTTEQKTRVNGGAPVHGSKGVVRSKYKVSPKVTYTGDGPRNATVSGQWSIMGMLGLDNTPNDYGKKAMKMKNTHRMETGDKTTVLNAHSNVSKGEARNGQKAKRTLKESTENNDHNGNLGNQTPHGFVYDEKEYRAKDTMKEVYEKNDHMGYMNENAPKRGFVYDPNDIAKKTMKETNIHNNHSGNMQRQQPSHGVVYDEEEYKMRPTMKETNIHNKHNGNMQRQQPSHGVVYDENDYRARNTMKETTEVNDHTGNMNNSEKRGFIRDLFDKAKNTLKETLEINDHYGNMGQNQPSRGAVYDPDEYEFKVTHKQLLENNKRGGNIRPNEQRSYVEQQDDMRTTTKQTTMASNVVGITSGLERGDGYLIKEVHADPTHREQTSVSYMTNANKNVHGGYEVTEVQSVGTNRMFSVEYTGNTGNTQNTNNPTSYEDAYNATMKAVRDVQDKGFTPGASGPNAGLDPKDYHATTSKIGDIQNQYINERGVTPSVISNSLPQMSECNLTSMKEIVPNEPIADRINPVILDAFKSNPYTQSLESWA